jgi:2-(1,2-epoxy-1,2-dihydrophenyl)acetyl-CoA isomerase
MAVVNDRAGMIRTRRRGGSGEIGEITMDRPERMNALDVRGARDLRKAGLELCRDETVRVVVLRGAGGAFSGGADLGYVYDGGRADDLSYLHAAGRETPRGYGEVLRQILEYLHSAIHEFRRAPKPVVAAVDGAAAAGGLGLAICCDLVVASARSSFEFAYFKTALTGAESTTFFLPKLLGFRRAMDFALLGERATAAEAAQHGLISRVVADGDFETEVGALADRLAAGPAESFAASKRLLNQASGMERLDAHLADELETLVRVADGPDFAEGIEAFFGKREPRFGSA